MKKFDYNPNGYRCEYISRDKKKDKTENFFFKYTKDTDKFEIYNYQYDLSEKTLGKFKNVCAIEPDYFYSVRQEDFIPLCAFLSSVGNTVNNIE